MSKTWMIISGKGGVGRSTLTAALAVALANTGMQTVACDMDIGLRSLDLHLGMENTVVYNVLDYVRGDCKLSQAVLADLRIPELALLPAAQTGSPEEIGGKKMRKILKKLADRYEYVLVDTPAGISKGAETMLACAENTLLVVTPDDVAIRDAERLVELCRTQGKPAPQLVVNRVLPALIRSGDMLSPQAVANALDVPLLGYVPDDTTVLKALARHTTVMDMDGPARDAVERIAKRLTGVPAPMPEMA